MGLKKKVRVMVGTYWVNEHKDAPCSAEDANKYCDKIAEGFGKAMKKRGHSWLVNHDDKTASPEDWFEPHDNAARSGADSVHFALLASHGAMIFRDIPHPNPDEYAFVAPFGVNSPTIGSCHWQNLKLRTSVGTFRTRLGNKKLKWVVIDACESLQVHRPNHIKFKYRVINHPARQWEHTFHGINMVFGFTEKVSDASWTEDRGKDFGRRAGAEEKLKDAWLDEGYSWWCDDYPVAVACGVSAKDSRKRLASERINSRLPRLPNNRIKSYTDRHRD